MATVTSEQALGSLASSVHGSVLRPGDQAYDAARRIFNGMIDKRPRVIVQALGAGDVMQAVRLARGHAPAIQSEEHSLNSRHSQSTNAGFSFQKKKSTSRRSLCTDPC